MWPIDESDSNYQDKFLLNLYKRGDVSVSSMHSLFSDIQIQWATANLESEGLIESVNPQKTAYRITSFGNSVVVKYNNYSVFKNLPSHYPSVENFKLHLLSYANKRFGTFLPLSTILNDYAPQYPDEYEADERRESVTNVLKDMVENKFIEIQGTGYLYLTTSSQDANKGIRVYTMEPGKVRITDLGRKELKSGKVNLPMLGLINEEVETGDSKIDEQINHAKALFFTEPKTVDNLRSACETLIFILEPLRASDALKPFFADADVSTFFRIVNEFDIRHNKEHTKKIVHIEQFEWLFYSLLNTLNTYYKLIGKGSSGNSE